MSSSVFTSNISIWLQMASRKSFCKHLPRCHWWWSVVALCHNRQSIVAFPNFIARRNSPLCGLACVPLLLTSQKLAFWVRDKYAASNNGLPVCCLKHQASPTPGSAPLALSCQSDPRHPFISTEILVFFWYLFWGEGVQILALGCLRSANYCTSVPWVQAWNNQNISF